MWYLLYNTLLAPLRLVLLISRPFLKGELRERNGDLAGAASTADYWIHCASVGELSSVAGLIKEIRRREPGSRLVVSTQTSTGRARAAELLPGTYTFLAPMDSPDAVRRVFKRLRPRVIFVAETEIWPNLFLEAPRRGARIVILNGRLTPRSLRRYLLLRPLFCRVLKSVSLYFVQTESDRSAFERLGATREKIRVTGTMKSDLAVPSVTRESERDEFSIPSGFKLVVAGSVRPDEEKEVFLALKRIAQGDSGAYFAVAPRHMERARAIGALAREMGFETRSRTDRAPYAGERLLVLDTLGELVRLYAASDISFVGGSLKPYGGHNVLEPAVWSVPVLFGRFTGNCTEEASELLREGGGMRVGNWEELASKILLLLGDEPLRKRMGERAGLVVKRRAGVSVAVYEELLAQGLAGGLGGR